MTNSASRVILFNGSKITYSIAGEGSTIVFLHGFLGDSSIWESSSKRLTEKDFQVLGIDLPGHGKSAILQKPLTMELMAEVVKKVLDENHILEATFIGHSMGGYVTLAFAEKHSKYINGLCLFHSTALADDIQKKSDRNRTIALMQKNTTSFIKGAIPFLFAAKNTSKLKPEIQSLVEIAMKGNVEGYLQCLEAMRDRPGREYILEKANFPVHFIIGKYDPVVPWETLQRQSKLAKANSVTILDCGHMGFIEEPEKCLESILNFAKNCHEQINSYHFDTPIGTQ